VAYVLSYPLRGVVCFYLNVFYTIIRRQTLQDAIIGPFLSIRVSAGNGAFSSNKGSQVKLQ